MVETLVRYKDWDQRIFQSAGCRALLSKIHVPLASPKDEALGAMAHGNVGLYHFHSDRRRITFHSHHRALAIQHGTE